MRHSRYHWLARLAATVTRLAKMGLLALGIGWMVLGVCTPAAAQLNASVSPDLRLAREDDDLVLYSQLSLELPLAVEDALQKGVALFFVVEAEVNRDRWYWYDKKLAQRSRHFKLLYQPLIRKWRVYVSVDSNPLYEPGMSLPQSFERLPDALASIGRSSAWRLLPLSELDPDGRYTLSFRIRLDTTALPRPMQIGLIGQSDWALNSSKTQRFTLDSIK